MPDQTSQEQLPVNFYEVGSPGTPYHQIVAGGGNFSGGRLLSGLSEAQQIAQINPKTPVSGLGIEFTRDQLLSGNIPSSGFLAQGAQPGTSMVPVEQNQKYLANEAAVKAGIMKNMGTAVAPKYIPTGSPGALLQSNPAGYAAKYGGAGVAGFNPPGQYQEVDTSKRYQEAIDAAKAAGIQSPSDYTGANTMFNQFLSPPQVPSAADTFVSTDPNIQVLIKDYQTQMSSLNTKTSLVDTYKSLLKDSGIPELDTKLLNINNIMKGTENDIRTEITKAGGFATNSQVLALTNARNKQNLMDYNTLLATRDAAQKNIDTQMNLTEKDRQEASQKFNTMMNFGQKIVELNQTMQNNAVETINKLVDTVGWKGVFDGTRGNTQLQSQIERLYGLANGGLVALAQSGSATKDEKSTVNNLIQSYPDAGILPTDSLTTASQKAASSPSFKAKNEGTIRAIVDPSTGQVTYYYSKQPATSGGGNTLPTTGGGSSGNGGGSSTTIPTAIKSSLENYPGGQYIDMSKLSGQAQIVAAQKYSTSTGTPLLSKEDANKVQEANQSYQSASALINQIRTLTKNVITASNDWFSMSTQAANLYRIEKLPTTSANNNAKQFIAARQALLSLITRAAGEKGTLTDNDVNRIANALPSYGDNKDLAIQKASNLDSVVQSVFNGAIKAYITSNATSGSTKSTQGSSGQTSTGLNYKIIP